MSFSIMMWLRLSIDFKILKQSLETVRFASSSMLTSGTVIAAKVSLFFSRMWPLQFMFLFLMPSYFTLSIVRLEALSTFVLRCCIQSMPVVWSPACSLYILNNAV